MMIKLKLFIRHPGGGSSQPSSARVLAYSNFFKSQEIYDVSMGNLNAGTWFSCFFGRYDAVILSMPQFRGWSLFFSPFTRVILDIRDGWSIAMDSGYGGNFPCKPFKAKIARFVEKYAIRRSYLTITCTTGLQEYLQKISGRKVFLIPNGVACDDFDIIFNIKNKIIKKNASEELVFCCAGQFSEYGKRKVKNLLGVIAKRYSNRKLKIKLIGSDRKKNDWVAEYFQNLTAGAGVVEIMPRMNKYEMYAEMIGCDYGLSIIRDPNYEYGTKIYEYIALGLPVVNYFDRPNNFTNYFDACLDESFEKKAVLPEIRRSVLIENALANIEW